MKRVAIADGIFNPSYKAMIEWSLRAGIKLVPYMNDNDKIKYGDFNNPKVWVRYDKENKEGDLEVFSVLNINREDKHLCDIIDEMGETARGIHCRNIKVVTIPDIDYYIETTSCGKEVIHEIHRTWE